MTKPAPSVSEYRHLETPAELAKAWADGELTRGELMARAVALLTTDNVDEVLATFDGQARRLFVQFAWEYATTPGAPSTVLSGLAAPTEDPEETLRALRIIAGVDERGEPSLGVLIGARLRELRIEAELTGTDVAEAAGMHREVYARLERGLHVPEVQMLQRAARALDVAVVDILVVLDPEWRQIMGWSPRSAYHPVLLAAAQRIRITPRQRRWRKLGLSASVKARR